MTIQQKVFDQIDSMQDQIINTISELVQIPSVIGNEGNAQLYVKNLYEKLGLDVKVFEADRDKVSKHPAYVEVPWSTEGRPNVIGILEGSKEGRSLILNAHIDVVSPEPVSLWTHDPWGGEQKDGYIYGRGSSDMKAGLIANYFALKAVLDSGVTPFGTVMLQSTIEEEAGGGGGALATLLEGYTADAIVIPEPVNMNIILGHIGMNCFRIKVKGKSAHGGEAHHGVNAIGKMLKIYEALVTLDEYRAGKYRNDFFEKWAGRAVNICIGKMNSGDWPSTVPGYAELEGRIAFIHPQNEAEIKAELEETVHHACMLDPWLRENPATVEWFGWHTEPWVQDKDHPFVNDFRANCKKVLTDAPVEMAAPFTLDSRFASFFDMASICFGPKGNNFHGVDERVEIKSVIETTKILALTILSWCNTKKEC